MLPKHLNKDCRRFREMISPYLDGKITQDEKQALERHLVSCNECREEWASLRDTIGLLRRLPQAEVTRSFTVVESKPAAVPSIFGRLCWASAIAAMILVLVSAGDMFHIYPEKTTGPSDKLAITTSATPTPSATSTTGFAFLGKEFGQLTGTPPPDMTKLSAQFDVTPIPSPTDNAPALPTVEPSPVLAADNTAVSTEAANEGYRWPVHQIEFAVLGIAVVMLAAVIIVWRRGEGSSTKG